MSGKSDRYWAYTFERHTGENGIIRNFAQFICHRCGAVLDIGFAGSKPPEFFLQKAALAGWSVHERRRARCRCPACQHPEATTAGVPMLKQVDTKPVPERKLSADDRLKVRGLLDKHFDDAVGEYLDGMTDAKLGEITDLPWASIAAIRELAYGPIRVDPELSALNAQISAVEVSLAQIKSQIAAYMLKRPV